ncbi:YesL family protein [Cellulosilyticum ruminicola]|uniref:YesL family protein n=1 Tax=Cellulosilyticum ruminicola TaxID=425254 RepID=UPI0006D10286|nr:DUF624 domain-containing protein [Cellulosilyticum ruminicola]
MFSNLLSPDNPIMQFITKLAYTIWLNILWFICCIPIVTIGPSTAALFYCCQNIVNDTEGRITNNFFKSFKANMKQGIRISVILIALGSILTVDGYVLYHLYTKSVFWTILTAIFIVACIIFGMILMYIFPLLARFQNTTFAMFKNALILSVRYLLCTILMALIYFAMLVIVVRFYTPAIIFGMGTCAFLCSLLLSRIIKQLET